MAFHTTASVTVTIPERGTYAVSSAALDWAIQKYLPASPVGLRAVLAEHSAVYFDDVFDVSALLVVLADLTYPYGG